MEALGRSDVSLEGMDLKLHDDPENYRRAVRQIKEDPNCLGALVTAHKINLLHAARAIYSTIWTRWRSSVVKFRASPSE